MKTAIVAGPPGAGKTALVKSIAMRAGVSVHAAKVDAVCSDEASALAGAGLDVDVTICGDYCPDHIHFIEFAETIKKAGAAGAGMLIIETAGLCGRCTPFLRRPGAVCVLPYAGNPELPARMYPLTLNADIFVLTKGDLLSSAERHVFRRRVREMNDSAAIIDFNGLTGEGALKALSFLESLPDVVGFMTDRVEGRAPRGFCSLCHDLPGRE